MARYRIHQMIQDLLRDPEAAKVFAADPEPAFDRYDLDDREKGLLRVGTPPALHELGVHPNLQMKLKRLRAAPHGLPTGSSPATTIGAYLDSMLED